MAKGLLRTDIKACARCGAGHPGLEFAGLTRPVVAGPYAWTHWAACPANGEPLLLRVAAEGVGATETEPR